MASGGVAPARSRLKDFAQIDGSGMLRAADFVTPAGDFLPSLRTERDSMLFLYRPRQTWMPYRLPREATEQAAYNRQLQERFEATRRVPRSVPAAQADTTTEHDVIANLKQLAELHTSGVLSDSEFAALKARLIGSGERSE